MERTPKTKLLAAALSCLAVFVLLGAGTKAQGAEAESLPEQIAEKSGLTEAILIQSSESSSFYLHKIKPL